MSCVIHGDSTCPPLCHGVITKAPPAVDAPADGDAADSRLDVTGLAGDQRAREVFTAGLDVGKAMAGIADARRAIADLRGALDFVEHGLDDATDLLRKYDASK